MTRVANRGLARWGALITFAVLTIAAGVMTSCSSASMVNSWNDIPPVDQPATLTVANRNRNEVVVFLLVGSARMRLASVPSGDHVRLSIPPGYVGAMVRLLLCPRGTRSQFPTNAVFVGLGQEMDLIVAPDASLSVLTAW